MDQNMKSDIPADGPVATMQISDEFGSWPCTPIQADVINEVRWKLDDTLRFIANRISPENGRYLSIVKTKLEEAGMFAVKGIAKK